ncbi:MAG TPA: T9SS type A sorting domain-containing protein, partial [Bacteroidales bacterium]|nr:T9SS type A sorting domain-containing protein [Bacteroidales bacterium]
DDNMPGKNHISDVSNDMIASEDVLIRLFPNPATDYIYVESDRVIRQVSIFNSFGLIEKTQMPGERYTYLLDISDLQGGLYFIKVTFEDNAVKTMRFIINQK